MKKLFFVFSLFIGLCTFFSCDSDDNEIIDIEGTDVTNDSLLKGDTLNTDTIRHWYCDGCGMLFHYEDTLKYVNIGEELKINVNKTAICGTSINHLISSHSIRQFWTNKFIFGTGERYESRKKNEQYHIFGEPDCKFHWITYTQLNDSTLFFKIDKTYNGDIDWIKFHVTNGPCNGGIKFVLKK